MGTVYGGIVLLTVCIVGLLLSRMHETPKTDQKPKRWPWWASWALLGVVFTTQYWSHTVWNALPTGFWTLLLCVGFVFGVWRWIAFFAEKRAKGDA
jgi:hypothetical protein